MSDYTDKLAQISRTPCQLAVMTLDFCSLVYGAQAANLVTNGTMEADANWANYFTPATNERSTGQVHAGTYSRKLVVDSALDGIKSDTFTTVTGTAYRLSLWVWPLTGTSISAVAKNGDGPDYMTGGGQITGLVAETWNNVVFNFTENAGGAGAFIAVYSLVNGTFYIDDVHFRDNTCPATGAAGTECYNTFPTCQARTAFTRTTKDYKFTSHEAPLPFGTGERPYIKDISYLPTEIKDNLTVKGRVTLEMTDEQDKDIGIDPYVATRASVQGNFWKKLLARNPNYKGRPLKLYDGFAGLTETNFTTDGKMFSGIIDNITLGKGTVKIEAVDLLKALDQVEIPAKLNIKLASDISIDQTSITFISTDMASMATPTGYVRIDDEIIYYGAINTTTKIISSCTRAMFNTVADIHKANDKVQVMKYYAEDNPFDTMEQILTDAGIVAGDIDSAAFAAEKSFTDDMNVKAIISEPTKASELYYELVDLLGCKTWVSEALKITIARNLPNHPTRTYVELADNKDIVPDSCSVDLNQKSLITRCSVYWDKDVIGKGDEAASYARLSVALDADAEGVNEYNETAEKKIMSRWVNSGVAGTEEDLDRWIEAIASRQVWQFRDPQPLLTLDLEIKNSGLLTGQYARITTDELQDANGNDLDGVTFQAVRRERKENKLTLKCLRLTPRRICYIAPDDAPDFDTATAAEKEQYGYICEDNNKMADGTEGYYIY